MNSVCEVQEFCTQETRLWAPRAHEEEARSRVFHTHRHLHCGTKGVEKGSGQRLYSPGASLYKGSVQRTRSGRVRIDDCRISARLCASHLHGNADLPGTWFKPHCAVPWTVYLPLEPRYRIPLLLWLPGPWLFRALCRWREGHLRYVALLEQRAAVIDAFGPAHVRGGSRGQLHGVVVVSSRTLSIVIGGFFLFARPFCSLECARC